MVVVHRTSRVNREFEVTFKSIPGAVSSFEGIFTLAIIASSGGGCRHARIFGIDSTLIVVAVAGRPFCGGFRLEDKVIQVLSVDWLHGGGGGDGAIGRLRYRLRRTTIVVLVFGCGGDVGRILMIMA